MSDAAVYIVQCCFASHIEKTIGPFGNQTTAEIVADVVSEHFHSDGDRHVYVEKREIVQD